MTLPSTGTQISLDQVNVELGITSATTISLNDTPVRNLAGALTGIISMANLGGKSFWKIRNAGFNDDGNMVPFAYSPTLNRWVITTGGQIYYKDSLVPNPFLWGNVAGNFYPTSPGPIWNGTRYSVPAAFNEHMYSSDGISWTFNAFTGSSLPQSVAVNGAGLLVAVGTGGVISTSADGITWTTRTSGVTVLLTHVIWMGSQFYVVGQSGVILRSTDGITWNSVGPGGTIGLNQIAHSGSVFVAVGASGTAYRSTTGDSGSWTTVTITQYGTSAITGVAWIPAVSLFVATGAGSLVTTLGTTVSSTDGTTWTTRSKGVSVGNRYSTVNGRVFNIGGSGFTGMALETRDGINYFTSIFGATIGSTSTPFMGAYSPTLGMFCIPCGQNVLTSVDGSFWTLRATGITTSFSISWINNRFVVAGSTRVASSTDGINWTAGAVISGASNWSQVAFGAGLYVVVGFGQIYTSPDLVTWTARTSPTASALFFVQWSGTRFVACGIDGNNSATSTDGITWSLLTVGTTSVCNGLVWNGSEFIAVFGSATAYSSATGTSWTLNSSSAFGRGLSYDPTTGYYIIDFNYVLKSPNGKTGWTVVYESPASGELLSTVAGGGTTVAFGRAGTIISTAPGDYYAVNGINLPTLGNTGVASWPPSGWTSLQNGNADDAFVTVPIPFTFTIAGTGYTSAFVGSNGYVTFGSGSTQYSALSAANPAFPKFMLGAADNSYQRVAYLTSGTDYVRIRFEGNGSTGGTLGSPGIVYEMTFFNPNKTGGRQLVEVRFGLHNRTAGQFGVANSSAYYASSPYVAPIMSYVFSGNSTGTSWVICNAGYVFGWT